MGTGAGQRVVDHTGTAFVLAPIGPEDADALVEFHERLSPESSYLRYFSSHPHLSEAEVRHLTEVDGYDRFALVAWRDDRIAAVARLDRPPGTAEAEVAFVVADDRQHHGLGGLLFAALARAAAERGIHRFCASVLSGNAAMLGVFLGCGHPVELHRSDGVIDVVIDLDRPAPARP